MSWTARKPVFERTIDFLIELPLGIVESILKMSMDRSNYKALRYAIGSGSTPATARNEVLHLIDRITTDKEFLRKQLTFDIQLDHMIEENTTHGDREWCRHKFLRYQEEHDLVKYIMFGYKCIQYLRHQSPGEWDTRDRTTVIIIDFWKMYSHSRSKYITQEIINGIRLLTGNDKMKNRKVHLLSFKTDIVCKEKRNTTNEIQVNFFLRLELIANNYILFRHVDNMFHHRPSTKSGRPAYLYRYGFDEHPPFYRCVCPDKEYKNGNSGTMCGWTLVSIIRRGRFYSGNNFYVSSLDNRQLITKD